MSYARRSKRSGPRRYSPGDEDPGEGTDPLAEARRDLLSPVCIGDHGVVRGAGTGNGDRFGAGVTYDVGQGGERGDQGVEGASESVPQQRGVEGETRSQALGLGGDARAVAEVFRGEAGIEAGGLGRDVHVGNDHDKPETRRCGDRQWLEEIAAAAADGATTEEKEGDVATEMGGELVQLGVADVQVPELARGEEGGGGVAGCPTETGGGGDALGEVEASSARMVSFITKKAKCAQGKVVVAGEGAVVAAQLEIRGR